MPKEIREEKEYAVLQDAHDTIVKLKERYPKILWPIIPEQIVVLGITNKERPKKMKKLAQIHKLTPQLRAILSTLRSGIKYYIEIYCSDWTTWSNPRRQWIIFHELIHVPGPDEKSLIKHDVEDFGLIIDAIGIDWFNRESLPDLIDGEEYPFKESLSVRLHMQEDNDGENGEQ